MLLDFSRTFYCYGPIYRGIFLVCENILGNKPDSGSDSGSFSAYLDFLRLVFFLLVEGAFYLSSMWCPSASPRLALMAAYISERRHWPGVI